MSAQMLSAASNVSGTVADLAPGAKDGMRMLEAKAAQMALLERPGKYVGCNASDVEVFWAAWVQTWEFRLLDPSRCRHYTNLKHSKPLPTWHTFISQHTWEPQISCRTSHVYIYVTEQLVAMLGCLVSSTVEVVNWECVLNWQHISYDRSV